MDNFAHDMPICTEQLPGRGGEPMPGNAEFWPEAAEIARWSRRLQASLPELLAEARALKLAGHGDIVSFSPKVFIPLTQLCRDVCGYCTFAHPPRKGERAYMTPEAVLAVARAGAAA